MAEQKPDSPQLIEVDEKVSYVDAAHLEGSLRVGLSYDDAAFMHDMPEKAHNKAFRKVDWRLMPMLMSLYLIANLDRYVKSYYQ